MVAASSDSSRPSSERPAWQGRALSPMLMQWAAAKAEQPDALLLFRMGDFYELFFEDATLAASLLDLTLTSRDKGEQPVPMAGVPHFAVEGYIGKLVALGHSVVVCEQTEPPKGGKGLCERRVTRLITPSTLCDLSALEPSESRFLAGAVPLGEGAPPALGQAPVALALVDVLTGELLVTVLERTELSAEMAAMGVREAVLPPSLLSALRAEADPSRPQPVLRPLTPTRAAEAGGHVGDSAASAMGAWTAPLPSVPPAARPAMVEALGGALAFGSRTQRRPIVHLRTPRWYTRQEHLVLDPATQANLELFQTARGGEAVGSLFAHLNRTSTAMGARLLRRWLLWPLLDLPRIARRADAVELLCRNRSLRQDLRQALGQVRDISRLLGRVALGRASPRDLQALAASLVALGSVQSAFRGLEGQAGNALLAAWQRAVLPTDFAEELLTSLVAEPPVVAHEGGIFVRGTDQELDRVLELTDGAEAWLASYEASERQRLGQSGLRVRFNRVFGYTIELSRRRAGATPAGYVRRQTTANHERFATAELDDFASRARTATEQRCLREAALFAALLERVLERLPALQALADQVAQLDALMALAEVADRHRYVRPCLVTTSTLELTAARHPVLETLLPNGERFVANDVALLTNEGRQVLLTGPNMAGKSTVMRQAALAVVLAQMGGFVPAEAATLGLVDQLFVRVGASDNLSRGQSTFMVEMVETATILRQATTQSLVLLDEIGRGTATFDGLAIAWAVAEYLERSVGCRALFATHYHELCQLADERPTMCNMHMSVHEENGSIAFLRQLRPGAAGRSYGIEVARLAGLPGSVLTRARTVLARLEAERPICLSELLLPQAAEAAALPPGDQPQQELPLAPMRPHLASREPEPKATAKPERPRAAWQQSLRHLDLDAFSPKEALLWLYRAQEALGDEPDR